MHCTIHSQIANKNSLMSYQMIKKANFEKLNQTQIPKFQWRQKK